MEKTLVVSVRVGELAWKAMGLRCAMEGASKHETITQLMSDWAGEEYVSIARRLLAQAAVSEQAKGRGKTAGR